MCEFQESRVIIRQWRMFALLLILKLSQRVLLDVSAQTSRLLSCLMLVVDVFIISTREPFEKLISTCSCMMSSVDWNQLLMATCECRPPACAFICKWHIFGTIWFGTCSTGVWLGCLSLILYAHCTCCLPTLPIMSSPYPRQCGWIVNMNSLHCEHRVLPQKCSSSSHWYISVPFRYDALPHIPCSGQSHPRMPTRLLPALISAGQDQAIKVSWNSRLNTGYQFIGLSLVLKFFCQPELWEKWSLFSRRTSEFS